MRKLEKSKISRFKAVSLLGGMVTPLLLLSCTCGKFAQTNSYQHASVRSDSVYTTQSVRSDRYVRDSIYQRDSIRVLLMGDTVYTDRWHTRYVYKNLDVLQTDTVCKNSAKTATDTVTVVKTEYTWKEKAIPAWRRVLELAGGLGVLFLLYIIIDAFRQTTGERL